jgi:nucleoside-diphosphate-sugar epimerase
MAKKLIFGCGYLGVRVAKRWQQAGDTVFAVTRRADRAAELRNDGLVPLIADICQPDSLRDLPSVETVLFSVGYDRSSAESIGQVYVGGLSNTLQALSPSIQRFIYTSSTGVYGQSDGQWVDENAGCQPTRAGGVACLEAERALLADPMGRCAVILRLAGIYGPGRIPRVKQLQAGEAIAAPSEGYLNLIHVDDAARIVLAAEARGRGGTIYCVSDGQAVLRRDYYEQLARLTGSPPPRFAPPSPDSPASQRAGSSKRVRNQRMLSELQVRLDYPSYREGLGAIVRSTDGSGCR